ncbi:MAG TPA: vWA domain-containing protein [Marinospirillum sp.]|uniref:vWA domain-containing protein n=1 Tax=Marinospirillum sp. TaxID=2183934 RepID=UPI002B467489|nr:vWA domain-containing protein [Marinospirillum sp.]HKM14394.1 vWA domain-containing protein [Marinospirillum sp.]
MFGRKTIQKLMLLVLITGLLSVTKVFAAQPDVRLVADVSGSMKRTDPNNLRIPATNLLIDLLPADSKAGIWTFGAYSNSLVPHGNVNESWRSNARNQAKKINSVGLFTDIENAIERATSDVNQSDKSPQKHLVLISDGLIDVSEAATATEREAENQQSRDHLLRVLVPKLAKAGYTIHTLALSDEADHDLMATMAQRTGGLHAIAYKATDLMPLLLQIINRLAPSEEVPLQDNRFLIDPTIDEFTLLVFHGPGAAAILHDPNGKTYTHTSNDPHLRWHSNDRYTMVTVESPLAGKWYIETPEHPDNRVTVISDIRLHSTNLPPTIFRGYPQTLEAWFTEEGRPIDRREFLNLLETKATHQKGAQQLGTFAMPLMANKPRYQLTLNSFPQIGEQTLKVEVDGRTFVRQVTHSFNVQDVVAASLQLPDDGSSPRVILRAQHPDLQPADIYYIISANDQPLTAEYRGDGEWKVDLANLDRSVAQTIQVLVQINQTSQQVSIELPELILTAKGEANPPPAPVLIPNPVPQVMPLPVLPIGMPVATPESEPMLEETLLASAALDEDEIGLFDPIESWDDPRMPWVYVSVGLANIALFLVAFFMYRAFINKRKARQDLGDDEGAEPLLDLDGSLGADLDGFEENEDDLDDLDDFDELNDDELDDDDDVKR